MVEFLHDEIAALVGTAARGARPHLHREHADAFYVLEGEHVVLTADGEIPLAAGGFVVAAPWVVHGFAAGEARYLNLHAPGTAWVRQVHARREGRREAPEVVDTYGPEGGRGAVTVVEPGGGELLEDGRRRIWIKAAQPQLCVFEGDVPAGFEGPPRHVHRRHVDGFYVLEGELEVEVEGERQRALAGEWIAAEPGAVHTFGNAGDGKLRFLNVHAPGMGFDEYLRRLDELAQRGERPPEELHARHDVVPVR